MADYTFPKQEYDFCFPVIIIGDTYVGKSSLLLKFADDSFQEHIDTINVGYVEKVLQIEGSRIMLRVMDTFGNVRYWRYNTSCCRKVRGIIVAYDVTSQKSFNQVGHLLELVDAHARKDSCKFLIGCKNDLRTKKTVDFDTAKAFADQQGLEFFETSAKDGTNVEEAFMAMATEIMHRPPPPVTRTRPPNDLVGVDGGQPAKKTSWFSRLFDKS
ncbi:ras-related protein Rab-1A [Rhipicephalus sanguineus]|uniref:ras-related protein Rab-1A n=1 Tax=Rhipicephalus sanguineus TaxID=34632 RepID=UPI001893B6BA|nr:ras-related protein Rab-1A [Rhipicephalus sanguineus]